LASVVRYRSIRTCSGGSVITNTKCHEKPGTGNDSTTARVAIVDPELMISLPREVTRNTGIDVLFHSMEAFIANVATPFTDLFAREAIRLVVENLGTALDNGKDLEARSRMAWANTIAGIAIGEGKSSTVGIHALGHSIGGQTDAPHGLTMAAVGTAYMARTWDADIPRYAEDATLNSFVYPVQLAVVIPQAFTGGEGLAGPLARASRSRR
jgi:alcohol dehydrogenase